MRSEFHMPDYYDLDIRFWERDLESYAGSLGFRKICCFSPEGNGVEIKGRGQNDLNFKREGKLILFLSEDIELLKRACRKDVGMLLFPRFLPDAGLIKTAAENRKPFEIPISMILNKKASDRAFMISKISFFLKMCNKYGADFVLTSGASSKFLMKSPAELVSLGQALGLSPDQAVKSVSMIPEYVLEG